MVSEKPGCGLDDLRNNPFCFDVLRFSNLGGYDDGSEREWRQVGGGGWVLPFDGAAEYVPELKLWMGFSSSDIQQLCAWDLSGIVVSEAGRWSFDSVDSVADKFAVLTGIEMVADGQEGRIKMIRHKSIRYMFTNEMVRWVL
ncbi:hypothetical protein HU200_027876 [Digitaria exilis]|uniref:Uncharacterized protein n=1 Tax=Digitaria exilis TaxID=1010633 RepID=A0A835EU46_9POAL|nr:hypothetical protein HU200_027876 [Digitaria exilis]